MMSWDVYHPLEDMYEYMDYLEGTLHDETVSTKQIGSQILPIFVKCLFLRMSSNIREFESSSIF